MDNDQFCSDAFSIHTISLKVQEVLDCLIEFSWTHDELLYSKLEHLTVDPLASWMLRW